MQLLAAIKINNVWGSALTQSLFRGTNCVHIKYGGAALQFKPTLRSKVRYKGAFLLWREAGSAHTYGREYYGAHTYGAVWEVSRVVAGGRGAAPPPPHYHNIYAPTISMLFPTLAISGIHAGGVQAILVAAQVHSYALTAPSVLNAARGLGVDSLV